MSAANLMAYEALIGELLAEAPVDGHTLGSLPELTDSQTAAVLLHDSRISGDLFSLCDAEVCGRLLATCLAADGEARSDALRALLAHLKDDLRSLVSHRVLIDCTEEHERRERDFSRGVPLLEDFAHQGAVR